MHTESLSASLEDYLEAIHDIVREKGAARGKDIAERLGVNRSSVTGALRSLSSKTLINYTPYDIVTLTPEGERRAAEIRHRHEVLKRFLLHVLGVDASTADENACRMEHIISEEVLGRLAEFIDFVQTCSRINFHWVEDSKYICRADDPQNRCEHCVGDIRTP